MYACATACVYASVPTNKIPALFMPSGRLEDFCYFIMNRQIGQRIGNKVSICLCLSGAGMDGICFSSLKGSGLAHDKIFAENTLRPKGARKIFRKTAARPDLARA